MNWLHVLFLSIRVIDAAVQNEAAEAAAAIQLRSRLLEADTSAFTSLGNAVRCSDYVAVWQLEQKSDLWYGKFKSVEILKGAPRAGSYSPERGEGKPPFRYEFDPEQPGRLVAAFVKGNTVVVCSGSSWQVYILTRYGSMIPRNLIGGNRDDDARLPTLYSGSVDDLINHIRAIAAGKEVVVTAEKPNTHPRYDISIRPSSDNVRLWRIKASMKIAASASTIRAANFVGMGAGAEADLPVMAGRLKHVDPCRRQIAINELASLGPLAKTALPDLWNCFADREPLLRIQAAEAALTIDPDDRQPLLAIVRELLGPNAEIRDAAARSLAKRPADQVAVFLPQAITAFSNEQHPFRFGTIDLLGTLAERASPSLKREMAILIARKIRSSDAEESNFRERAAGALMHLGADCEPAIPILKRLVKHGREDADVYASALALAQFASDGPAFLGRLLAAPQIVNREAIVRALGRTGPRAGEALTALSCLVESDDDVGLRIAAINAIGQIDPLQAPSYETLLTELYKSQGVRIAFRVAERSDWLYGASSDRSLEARRSLRYFLMRQILNADPNQFNSLNVRINALEQLAAQGAEARDAAPELWRLLKKADPPLRANLIDALWRIDTPCEENGLARDPRAQLLVIIRKDLWRYGEQSTMVHWLANLPEIDVRGASLIPELVRLSRAKNRWVAQSALSALRAMGPAAKEAIPDLIRLLDKDDIQVQRTAILALCTIGRGHPLAVQRLRDWCETEDPDIVSEIAPKDLGKENITPLLLKIIRGRPDLAGRATELLKATDPAAAKQLANR